MTTSSRSGSSAEQETNQNRRRYVRLDVTLPATLTVGESVYDAEVINISQSGAMLLCAVDVAFDDAFQLELEEEPPLQARVIWQDGNRIGVAFLMDEARFDRHQTWLRTRKEEAVHGQ